MVGSENQTPFSPKGILKLRGDHSNISVHMGDQNFSQTPINEFLLPDKNHRLNEFTMRTSQRGKK